MNRTTDAMDLADGRIPLGAAMVCARFAKAGLKPTLALSQNGFFVKGQFWNFSDWRKAEFVARHTRVQAPTGGAPACPAPWQPLKARAESKGWGFNHFPDIGVSVEHGADLVWYFELSQTELASRTFAKWGA